MRIRTMRIPGLVAALFAALLVLVTGCGSTGQAADQGDSAGSAGAESGSANAAELTKANFSTTLSEAQRGTKTFHLEMKVSGHGQSIRGQGDVSVTQDPKDLEATLSLSPDAGAGVEIRMIGTTLYVKTGSIAGGKFVKMDLSGKNNPMGRSIAPMLNQLDPAKKLEQLDEAIVSVEPAGDSEELDGVQAQPYKVVVDTTKLSSQQTGGLPAMGQDMPKKLTFTYWIGSDNLPRKVVTDISGMSVETTFSDWGKNVEVQPPPSDKVTDFKSLEDAPNNEKMPTG